MAVKGIVQRSSSGSASTQDAFSDGTFMQVNPGGHLVVQAQANNTLGIYVPGKWGSTYKDDSAQVNA